MKDTYQHKGLRKRLVRELERKGIKDSNILQAIGNVPRHLFLDNVFAEWAYKDRAFSIGEDQTISQPYTVAVQTALLDVKSGSKVLEIGTGSGYQAAILAELGCTVYTIERIESLYKKSKKILQDLQYTSIYTYYGDGHLGLSEIAPFDGIIATAGSEDVPQDLLHQLRISSSLIIPIGTNGKQIMYRIKREDEHRFKKTPHGQFAFVPFLKGLKSS